MANEDLLGDDDVVEEIDLSPRQEAFCQQYIALKFNGTRAAIAAGYAPIGAGTEADRLLQKAGIRQRIAQISAPTRALLKINADEILHQLASVATFDRRKLLDTDGNVIPLQHLDDATAAAISHVGVSGFVPFDKMKAVDMAMKHLGLFKEDNTQQQGQPLAINIKMV